MNRGTLKIEPSHTNGVQVSLILSDDGTVWMSVEEIAHTFNILAASVVRQIKKILAAGELYEKRYVGNRRPPCPMEDCALRSIIISI